MFLDSFFLDPMEKMEDDFVCKSDINTPVKSGEKDNNNADNSIDTALKLSREYISLLEDYRFLLSCFQDTCGCHANFDHQIFLRKLEQRYNKLTELTENDSSVSKILIGTGDDDDDSFDQIDELIQINQSLNKNSGRKEYIHRVKIFDRNRIGPYERKRSTNVTLSNYDKPSETVKIDEESLKEAKTAYKCKHKHCDFISFTMDGLLEHSKSHMSFDLTIADLEKKGVVYVCQQCGKEFAGQKWLDNHIENTHSSLKMYSCDHPGCSYQSKFRCVVEDHKRRHSKTKEFKCDWEDCESEFVTRRDMMAHINFYHKGIKNYICTWPKCEASFKDSNRLKHHFYIHTGERPYKCDAPGCEASFKQLPHLNKHKRVHLSYGRNQETQQQSSSPVEDEEQYEQIEDEDGNVIRYVECP